VSITEPVWIVVRATAPLSAGGELLLRDHVATVDATDEGIRDQLRAGWLVPLPAAEQPALATDPETHEPILAPAQELPARADAADSGDAA
jgi:hypothetical protein